MLENELLDFGKWKNFMFDQWLAICWDIIETAATIHFSKITQMFATLWNLSIYISVNEWTLNSIRTCCYFGLHFGWWTKLLNLAQDIFHLFPKLSKRKIMWSEVSNSRELNASTTMKAFTDSFFDFSTNFLQFFFTPIILQVFDLNHDY